MQEKSLPKIIKEVGFDFHWDNGKVWKLNLPVEEMKIEELEWHFNIPFWNQPNDGYYNLAPSQVIQNPNKYKEEFQRTMKVDMSYALDIMFWKNRWLLLDGLHRLVKAKLNGDNFIKVRKVPISLIPNIIKITH